MIIALLYTVIIFLVSGIVYFAFQRPCYSHLKHTISELGEEGAVNSRAANLGLFLPVGLLLILFGMLSSGNANTKALSFCLGAGYLISALFPCDPGSPLGGSTNQTVHNIGGFIEYAGGIYFLNRNRHLLLTTNFIEPLWIIGFLVVCIILTSLPGFKLRGLSQRILEAILFGQLLWLSYQ
ncbi:DUF998 domain-containing protein [Agriterribacter sp.]|uniref:DUF998 domain-containing protein n=1 Tax=Agriterribacter sp. TaxID=2821509 RepID=UPI002B8BC9CC|nr:DUF998 domain-containing protein [Agriterribacter sp.]HRP57141.1 DUF998 domain-containing protein [Agriterribacter sp.]